MSAETTVDRQSDLRPLIDIYPAGTAVAVGQSLQAKLERRLTVEARAIEIDAQADAAHDQTVAHQQHLFAGGDPELQVALLA
ncbi:hypothetical protein D3C81_1703620 [compost metagenome]